MEFTHQAVNFSTVRLNYALELHYLSNLKLLSTPNSNHALKLITINWPDLTQPMTMKYFQVTLLVYFTTDMTPVCNQIPSCN